MSLPSSCCTDCPDTELVEIPGIAGADGADGADGSDGVNAYSTIVSTETNVCPAVSASVTVTMNTSAWMVVGQNVYVQSVGHFRVTAKPTTTSATLYYLEYAGNTNAGAALASLGVSPSGEGILGLTGTTSPEGATTAIPGSLYLNTTDESVWIKKTGVGNTGWINVITCLVFMLSLAFSFGAAPILRQQFTTNTQANAVIAVANVSSNTVYTNAVLLSLNTNISYSISTNSTVTNMIRYVCTNAGGTVVTFNTNLANSVVTNHFADMTNAAKQGVTSYMLVLNDGSKTNALTFTGGILTTVVTNY